MANNVSATEQMSLRVYIVSSGHMPAIVLGSRCVGPVRVCRLSPPSTRLRRRAPPPAVEDVVAVTPAPESTAVALEEFPAATATVVPDPGGR